MPFAQGASSLVLYFCISDPQLLSVYMPSVAALTRTAPLTLFLQSFNVTAHVLCIPANPLLYAWRCVPGA